MSTKSLQLESKSKKTKPKKVSWQELIQIIQSPRHDDCIFDSEAMKLFLSFKRDANNTNKYTLTIKTGSLYRNNFELDSGSNSNRSDFLKEIVKIIPHFNCGPVSSRLYLDLILHLDSADSSYTKDFVDESSKLEKKYKNNILTVKLNIDPRDPKYLQVCEDLGFTHHVLPEFINPRLIQEIFSSVNRKSKNLPPIYTNTPSSRPILAKAVAKKPWYEHKNRIRITDIDDNVNLIFILADYYFYRSTYENTRHIIRNFYENIFLASQAVFLWTGDYKQVRPINTFEDAFQNPDFVAQRKNEINIETLRVELSKFITIDDNTVISILDAEHRTAAIKLIMEPQVELIERNNKNNKNYKIRGWEELKKPKLDISDSKLWNNNESIFKSEPRDYGNEIVVLGDLEPRRLNSLIKFIDTKTIKSLELNCNDSTIFSDFLKRCPRLNQISLFTRNYQLLIDCADELKSKLTELRMASCQINLIKFPSLLSLKKLDLDFCTYEDISEVAVDAFRKSLLMSDPSLTCYIGSNEADVRQIKGQENSLFTIFSKIVNSDDLSRTIPLKDEAAVLDPQKIRSPRTGPIGNELKFRQRFYTSDTSILNSDASRCDQDVFLKLIIDKADKPDEYQIGFISDPGDFIADETLKLDLYQYDRFLSLQQYKELEKELKIKIPNPVGGRIDEVLLRANTVYVLPSPEVTSDRSWQLVGVAFQQPELHQLVEIGFCKNLLNKYVLRLRSSEEKEIKADVSRSLKAYMVLQPCQPGTLPLELPSNSSSHPQICSILNSLIGIPKIKEKFPQFVELIANLNSLEAQKKGIQSQLQSTDQPLSADKIITKKQEFWRLIQKQFDLLHNYCAIGLGFKAEKSEDIIWEDFIQKDQLTEWKKYHGLLDLLNTMLKCEGECARACETFAFLAAGYELSVLIVTNQRHGYLSLPELTPCGMKIRNKTLDLGGAAPKRRIKQEFFPDQSSPPEFKSDETDLKRSSEKKAENDEEKQLITLVESKLAEKQSPFSLGEFKQFQHWSSTCSSATAFADKNLTSSSSLIIYRDDNIEALQGFIAILCQRFRQVSSDKNTVSVEIAVAKSTDKNCWIKLLDHPDDFSELWEVPEIKPNGSYRMLATPLQQGIPSLLILNISEFSAADLEVYQSLFADPPALMHNSQEMPLAANCHLMYLCSESQWLTQSKQLSPSLQRKVIPWPNHLADQFLQERAKIPLIQQLYAGDDEKKIKSESKTPSSDARICDLTTLVESKNLLTQKLLIDGGEVKIEPNPLLVALHTSKSVEIHHAFAEETLPLFLNRLVNALAFEQHALQNGRFIPLTSCPDLFLRRQSLVLPSNVIQVQDKDLPGWRFDKKLTAYILNKSTNDYFLGNWQADQQQGLLLSTSLPGILAFCPTSLALIQVTTTLSQADCLALFRQIANLSEKLKVAIWVHPNYSLPYISEVPKAEIAKDHKEIKSQEESPPSVKRNIFFAANSDLSGALQYLKITGQLAEDIMVVPINLETTQEELIESIKMREPDDSASSLQFKLNYLERPAKQCLKADMPVLLMGEISPELYESLESLLLNGYLWSNAERLTFKAQLFLLSPPNSQLSQHLEVFFSTQPIAPSMDDYLLWLKLEGQDNDKKNLGWIYSQTKDIFRWSWQRTQAIALFLKKYPQPTERARHFAQSPFQTQLLEDFNPELGDYKRYLDFLWQKFCVPDAKSIAEIKQNSTRPNPSSLSSGRILGSLTDEKKSKVSTQTQHALQLLKEYGLLFLVGTSGAGKTFTVLDLIPKELAAKNQECRLFIGEASIPAWLNTNDPGKIHILLLDEVNIFSEGSLQPLLMPGEQRFWQGEVYQLTSPHWLIGTGNPRLSYSGRCPVPSIFPTLWFQPFTPEDIYKFQIEPFLENKLKIANYAQRKELGDFYLKSHKFTRQYANVSPRNLNRVLALLYLQYIHNQKQLTPKLWQGMMKTACYIEFRQLLPMVADKKETLSKTLAATLEMNKPPALPTIPEELQNFFSRQNIILTEPLINLIQHLQMALSIRQLMVKGELSDSGLGILFQSADPRALIPCVTAFLEIQKLNCTILSVNPMDETGFKETIRKSLKNKHIILIANPHLITSTMEKWLNPLLEGMDVEQADNTRCSPEFYMIFLHREGNALPTAIKNRLQLVKLEECRTKDWEKIVDEYSQDPRITNLIVASFEILIAHGRNMRSPVHNPGDLTKLCDALKATRWFTKEKMAGFQLDSIQIHLNTFYRILMELFCCHWDSPGQHDFHNDLQAMLEQGGKRYFFEDCTPEQKSKATDSKDLKSVPRGSVENISTFPFFLGDCAPEQQSKTTDSNDMKSVSRGSEENPSTISFFPNRQPVVNCNNILNKATEFRRENKLQTAFSECMAAETILKSCDMQDLEIWKRLRSLYCDLYEAASCLNLKGLVSECVQQALEIDKIIVARGGESLANEINEDLDIFQRQTIRKKAIQKPEIKHKSDCAIM